MANLKKGNKAYDSADVTIFAMGNSPSEVSEITYGHEREHQLNYFIGSDDAQSWSMGKKTPNGSWTLSMREIVAFEDSIEGGSKDLTNVKPFEVYVTYANEYNKIVTDKVVWKFAGQGREVNGQMGLSRQMPMFVLSVEYNIA